MVQVWVAGPGLVVPGLFNVPSPGGYLPMTTAFLNKPTGLHVCTCMVWLSRVDAGWMTSSCIRVADQQSVPSPKSCFGAQADLELTILLLGLQVL